MDYSPEQVRALLQHWDRVFSFVCRTTGSLTPTFLLPADPDWFSLEGHTLLSSASKTTRVPKKNNLAQMLHDMLIDIDLAAKRLAPEERVAFFFHYIVRPQGRPNPRTKELADQAFHKVVSILNGNEPVF